MINNIIIEGYLAADAEIRYTATGTEILTFRIGNTEKWKEKSHTNWIEIVKWSPPEFMSKMKKGDHVFIQGRLRLEKSNEKYYTKVVAEKIRFAGKLDKSTTSGYDIQDDELPF